MVNAENCAWWLLWCLTNNFSTGKPVRGPVQVGKLKMSPIGCGTWSWGNRFLWQYDESQDTDLQKSFDYVTKQGVNWFDTADSYGTGRLNGRSEELLGQFTGDAKARRINKESFICTKLAPYPWRIGTESMKSACEMSAIRIGRPVDMLQLHWPPSFGWQEDAYLTAFADLVTAGRATQIGLSNYGPKGLRRVHAALLSRGAKVYSNQVRW